MISSLLLLSLASSDPPFEAPLRLLGGDEPTEPRLAIAGDVDGNGTVDLVRLHNPLAGSPSIEVLPGLGGGDLGAGVSTEVDSAESLSGASGHSLFLRDFDGSGTLDLVSGGHAAGDDALFFFAGNGDGTFAAPLDLAPEGLFAFTALRFDDDAPFELAVARRVLGEFAFAIDVWDLSADPPAIAATSPSFSAFGVEQVAPAGLDGSGRDALLVDTTSGDGIFVLPNLGGAALGGATFVATDVDGVQVFDRLVAADVDGDGDEDVVDVAPTELQVLVNTGGALSTLPAQALDNGPFGSPGPSTQVFAHAVDWDADGDGDVVALLAGSFAGNGDPGVALLSSQGDGTFAPAALLPDATSEPPAGVADLDGDGIPDWISARAWIAGGTPFTPTGDFAGSSFSVFDVAFDRDLDGDVDAMNGLLSSGLFFTMLGAENDATGHTQLTSLFASSPLAPGEYVGSAAVGGDLDGDGRPELLLGVLEQPGPFDPPIDHGWRRYELVPGGTYELVGTPLDDSSYVVGTRSLFLDVDGDGNQDVVTTASLGYQPGDGTGELLPQVSIAGSGRIVDVADVDGDTDVDLLVWRSTGGVQLSLLRSDGVGGYATELLLPNATSAARFLDLDQDSDPDVVAPLSNSYAQLEIFENTGGAFAQRPAVDPQLEMSVSSIACADADGDGDADLIAVAGENGPIDLIHRRAIVATRNGPGPSYDVPTVSVVWDGSTLGDADGDGDLDLFGSAPMLGRAAGPPTAGGARQYGESFPGAGGLSPLLGATGPLAQGSTTASLRVVGAVGGASGLFAVGSAEVALPNVPLPGLSLYVAPLIAVYELSFGGVPGEPGAGEWSFTFGNLAPLAGLTRYYQVFVVDAEAPQLVTATNGLEVTYGL